MIMMYSRLVAWISAVLYSLTFFLFSFNIWIPPAQADCIFFIFCNTDSFQSKGGVRRGPCATEENQSLIAFTPERKYKGASGRKTPSTTKAYPTFWFYIPQYKAPIQEANKAPIQRAKFALLDERNHPVQEPIIVKVPQVSNGVLAWLTLPATGKPLKVGTQYSWYFSIVCDPDKPARNPAVDGKIQVVLPSKFPKTQEPDYAVYDNTYKGKKAPESLVFYDTINQLVRNSKTYPSDWNEFLLKAEIPANTEIIELKP
jgi:hypothetical protein